jgi:two-component system, OmpR family, response regulator
MPSARLLVVEDDPRIASFLQRGLAAEGYGVDLVRDGVDAIDRAGAGTYTLIVLDYMLPGLDGLEVCSRLRKAGCRSLILMLTAKDGLQDKIAGLKGGADDYLTKPFAFDELLARIEALLRRGNRAEPTASVLETGDLKLDHASKTVWRGERKIELTAKEFALLAYLMENAGTVVSRAKLLSNVWGMNFDPGTKVVDVYIRYLRRKIDGDGAEPLIQTVRGFGYKIDSETGDEAPG